MFVNPDIAVLPKTNHLMLIFPPHYPHYILSQEGWFINVCGVPRMDVKLGIPSAGINLWILKISMVFFMKSMQAIADAIAKFQMPALP